MMKITAELSQAIEDCYTVFSGYSLADGLLDVCTECCMNADLEREMHTIPLRQITAKHFYQYNDSAKSAIQPVAEIKYLLPRMLDLIAQGEEVHHSTELYLDRLGNCEIGSFTVQEWQAIEQYAEAFLKMILNRFPWEKNDSRIFDHVFDYLVMLDIGGINIQRLLIIWSENATKQATLNYVESSFFGFWYQGYIDNAFADERHELKQTMTNWILDKENRQLFASRIQDLGLDNIPSFEKWDCGQRFNSKQIVQLTFNHLIDTELNGRKTP